MTKKLILAIGILISCHTVSKAQEKEYIVTFDNDTVYGNVRYGLKFKDTKGNKWKVEPDKISHLYLIDGFGRGNIHYESINKNFFLQTVLKGRINLYLTTNEEYGHQKYCLSKDSSEIIYLGVNTNIHFSTQKSDHAMIRELIKDNPELLKEFDSLKASNKNIQYIIKKYNESEK